MEAIRELKEVKDGKILINLPPSFLKKKVEVIILPFESEEKNESYNLTELLLKAPTLTEEELLEFEKVRNWIREWKIKEF